MYDFVNHSQYRIIGSNNIFIIIRQHFPNANMNVLFGADAKKRATALVNTRIDELGDENVKTGHIDISGFYTYEVFLTYPDLSVLVQWTFEDDLWEVHYLALETPPQYFNECMDVIKIPIGFV